MLQINVPWILRNHQHIRNVTQGTYLDERGNTQFRFSIAIMEGALEEIFEKSIYADLFRTCRSSAARLREDVREVNNTESWEEEVPKWRKDAIIRDCGNFLNIFEAELQNLPVFLVSRKDAYDTESLLASPYLLFPGNLLQKCPEAGQDILAIGRAIAFELPTAAGFHLFRMLEAVLRRYWAVVTDGKKLPKNPNLGSLINELKAFENVDQKVTGAIDQLRELHRNPLIHPEVNLTGEEAIGTLGQVRSAIGAMLPYLSDAVLEPKNPPDPTLPPTPSS